MEPTFLDTLRGYVTGIIARWILKIAGGFLLHLGVSTTDAQTHIYALVGSVLSFGIGAIISLVQHKHAALADPAKIG